ncbi:hypothetical protein PoB_005421200 [Plakobranchus ocellatus]|uniref:Uncharacterized protein n=1 Tax=Plakobranchus ocellatus TaxID=259542 RepID=A0AAV4C8V1_9GAST|nr:hypothetical protein PoB_005421200 [Plakobranchus ocellatus]
MRAQTNRFISTKPFSCCHDANLNMQTTKLPKSGEASVAQWIAIRPETLLSRIGIPPPAPWPDEEPESLRSPYCALAMSKKPNKTKPCVGSRS